MASDAALRRFFSSSLALPLEALERLERLPALLRPAEPAVDAGQHVVVRRRPRVEGDGLVQRLDRLVQASLALVGPGPSGTTRGRTSDRARSPCARTRAPSPDRRAVVVGAQVHVGRREAALPRLVQRDRLLVVRDRAGIVAQRFQREAERVERFDVRRDRSAGRPRTPCARAPSCPGSRRACRGCSGSPRSPACSGCACSNSTCAASNRPMIIRLRPRILWASAFSDIELERLRQRLDRFADLLLREQAVAERVPAPRRLRALLDVVGEQRLDFLELGPRGCSLRAPRPRAIVRVGYAGAGVTAVAACGLATRTGLSLSIERCRASARLGPELERTAELRRRLVEIALSPARRGLPRCRAARSGCDRRRRRARGPS